MKLFALLLILAGAALAQPAQSDCFIQIPITTTALTNLQFDNRGFNCQDWTVLVFFRGFTAASVQLESAPDNNGAPGAFTLFGGTVVNGVNPLNTFTQNAASAAFTGYFPWLRLNITSLTGAGSIGVTAWGFRPIAFVNLKPVLGSTNVTQIGGVNVFACNNQLPISVAATGNTQVIPHSGTNRTFICFGQVSWSAGINLQVQAGTGGTCAASNQNITGVMFNVGSWTLPATPFSPMIIPAGLDTCLNDSAPTAGGGWVSFTYQP